MPSSTRPVTVTEVLVPAPAENNEQIDPRSRMANQPRCVGQPGSGSACESDGDDSDGQGAPQGGGGVQSTPVSARAAEILRGLRGLEASFMRK